MSQNIHIDRRLFGASLYRARSVLATAFATLLLSSIACRNSPEPRADEDPATQTAEQDDAAKERAKSQRTEDVLFDAIIAECEERGYELATVSPKFYTVITGYEKVSARLRKRRIIKILILPRGGALNVMVSYERDAGVEGAPDWQVLEDQNTRTRAGREEMELARAIEQRLHAMKRERARRR